MIRKTDTPTTRERISGPPKTRTPTRTRTQAPDRSGGRRDTVTGPSSTARRSQNYVCGHCAVGSCPRCVRQVPVGRNVEGGPTQCHCENHG